MHCKNYYTTAVNTVLFLFKPHAVIVIGLVNTSLSVNESDGDVLICAKVENVIQINFTGSVEAIFITDLTTQGMLPCPLVYLLLMIWHLCPYAVGADFSAISQVFIFDIQYAQVDGQLTGEQQCITVSISDDAVHENDEMFSIFLRSTDPNIRLNPEFTNVTIIDDDGMSTLFPCKNTVCVLIYPVVCIRILHR